MIYLKKLRYSRATTIIAAFMSLSSARAATIKQLVSGDDFAFVMLTNEELAANPYYLLAKKDGKQCRLPIVLKKDALVKVSTKECVFKDHLLIDQSLELPLINEPIAESKAEEPPVAQGKEATADTAPQNLNVNITAASKREVTDLQYVPYEGQSLVSLSGSIEDASVKMAVNGLTLATSRGTTRAIDLTYIFGVTDRFSLGVIERFLLLNESNTDFGAASTKNGKSENYVSDGIGDPTLAFRYRGVEQSEKSAVSLDLALGYLIKSQDAKTATDDEKGNSARGGDGTVWELALSRKFGPHSLKATLSQFMLNKRTSQSSAGKSEETGGNTMSSAFAFQTELSELLIIGASLSYNAISSSEEKTPTQSINYASYNSTNIGLDLKCKLNPSTLYIDVGLLHTNAISQSATISGTAVNADAAASDRLTLGLDYVF